MGTRNYGGNFWDFCGAVSARIRFKPDREAVTEELMAHLEDRRDAYMSKGMTRQEAERQAIRGMGDPEEIGKALNKVHNPWLGWLQVWLGRLTAVVLVITAFAVLRLAGGAVSRLLEQEDFYAGQPWSSISDDRAVADYQPDALWRYDGYTFTIDRAVVVPYESSSASGLYYRMKVTHLNPWVRGPEFRMWLWAEDDLGNRYPSRGEQEENGFDLNRDSAGNPTQINAFSSYYDLWVSGIDQEASEVTLHFDRYGEAAILLTIPLRGGDGNG